MGNLYIADSENHRIRKVDASGAIFTVAGNGNRAHSGDGGPATDASIQFPTDIVVDSTGNIYIADRYNHRIRKVDTSSVITTVVGEGNRGLPGFSGDGEASPIARLNAPSGVAVDGAGNIYIADTGNGRIRKIDISDVFPPTLANFDGAQVGFIPMLEWDDVSAAVSYTLEYADNADFTNTVTVAGITENQYSLPSPLSKGSYFWRVKAVGTSGESIFSSSDSFEITQNHIETPVPPGSLPAFPGAEGFGAYTPGGRGGKVFLVTNLNDSGPGSLREAVEAKGPRVVVFRVSGIIELKSRLLIQEPYLTIAGQTTPGDGISLKNFALEINSTHDVVIRHLRFRSGDKDSERQHSLLLWSAQNVIIDHCSISWSSDKNISVWLDSDDVTVQWCMITESLNQTHHSGAEYGYASLLAAYNGKLSFHHNVYAHHRARIPRVDSFVGRPGITMDFRNNLIYNWRDGGNTSDDPLSDGPIRMNYVGNYLKSGPSTPQGNRGFVFNVGGPLFSRFFVSDNFLEGFPEKTRNNWLMFQFSSELTEEEKDVIRVPEPFPTSLVKTDLPLSGYRRMLANAGATLPLRDAVDSRIVDEIKSGDGRIIDSQDEVGGWPELRSAAPRTDSDSDGLPDDWEQKYGLNANDAADNSLDRDGDGYTNIEEFINGSDPLAFTDPTIDPLEIKPEPLPVVIPPHVIASADFDGDGTVGFGDFLLFASAFGARSGDERYDAKLDIDSSGDVGFSDFITFASAFGKSAGKQALSKPVDLSRPGANENAVLELMPLVGERPDEVVVQVRVVDAEQVGGYQLRLAYDDSRLDLLMATTGSTSLFAGHLPEANPVAIQIAWENGEMLLSDVFEVGAESGGELLTLTFRVNDPTLTGWVEISEVFLADDVLRINSVADARLNGLRALPTDYALSPNRPNPFNPETVVPYQMPEAGDVSLIVYNVLGQQVRELIRTHQAPGFYTMTWDGKDNRGRQVSSGIYLIRMEANAFVKTQKMLMLK